MSTVVITHTDFYAWKHGDQFGLHDDFLEHDSYAWEDVSLLSHQDKAKVGCLVNTLRELLCFL